MLKYFICLLFLLSGSVTRSQGISKISLSEFSIKKSTRAVKISKILDVRDDKNIIGIFRTGSQSGIDSTSFRLPGLQEVEELIKRSGLMLRKGGFLLRIRKLSISEITDTSTRFKAEIYADWFYQKSKRYYYAGGGSSSLETYKPKKETQSHAENIVHVIEGVLVPFFEPTIRLERAFTRKELMNPELKVR